MLKVKLPDWWRENGEPEIYGVTDGKVTYCCSSEPCYFVEVPDYEYEGYFKISDLTLISRK